MPTEDGLQDVRSIPALLSGSWKERWMLRSWLRVSTAPQNPRGPGAHSTPRPAEGSAGPELWPGEWLGSQSPGGFSCQ